MWMTAKHPISFTTRGTYMGAIIIILILTSALAFWGGVGWLIISLFRKAPVKHSLGLMLLALMLSTAVGIFIATRGNYIGTTGIILILASVLAFSGGVGWLIVSLSRKASVKRSLGVMLLAPVLFVVGVIFTAFGFGETEDKVSIEPIATHVAQAIPVPTAQAVPTVVTGTPKPTATPGPTATPKPTATPNPRTLGRNRRNPAPLGTSVIHADLEVKVLRFRRNYPRSSSYTRPKEGHEWVTVTLQIRNVSNNVDRTRRYSSWHFRITGDNGLIYEDTLISKADNPLGSGEFFGGAEITGEVVREIQKDDTGLILMFSPTFEGTRYLALEK